MIDSCNIFEGIRDWRRRHVPAAAVGLHFNRPVTGRLVVHEQGTPATVNSGGNRRWVGEREGGDKLEVPLC